MMRAEMEARGWTELDVLLVNGDAYVDHPAFGAALIGRFLEARGLRVGIISQPNHQTTDDLLRMGPPRLFVGITAGNLDSMLNKLTAQKKVRSEGSIFSRRSNGVASESGDDRLRQLVPTRISWRSHRHWRHRSVFTTHCPLRLLGRSGSSRHSFRRQSRFADFGMGERPVWEVAERLAKGEDIRSIRDVRGTSTFFAKGNGNISNLRGTSAMANRSSFQVTKSYCRTRKLLRT